MKIGIVNIGDELLAGKILNTNQFELSRLLAPLGHEIIFGYVIGDNCQALADTLARVVAQDPGVGLSLRPNILILTGGLGPTRDDLTREAVAGFLGCAVVEDPRALGWLSEFFGKPLTELPAGQRLQSSVPAGTEALRNPVGTACGFRFNYQGVSIYAFPGVPSELRAMTELHLVPELPQSHVLLTRSLWTFGWSEGSQQKAFAGLSIPDPFRFSSLPNEKGVLLSISGLVPIQERETRTAELESLCHKLVEAIPPESLVDKLGRSLTESILNLLLKKQASVSVAESCTGGGLGVLLTDLPGSSAIFQKGFLTYSNQAKIDLLGVDTEIINRYGAVSEETALAMVAGCLARSGADYACAITGIAGPDGGTPEKPIGTVWVAVASKNSRVARRFQFRGNRTGVRSQSCFTALNLLRLLISEKLN